MSIQQAQASLTGQQLFSGKRISQCPLATDHFEEGVYRYPPNIAYKKRYCQTNPMRSACRILLDIDRRGGADTWMDVGLPPPNWTATNRKNGNSHNGYELKHPVCTDEWLGRAHPIRYLAAIEAAMVSQVGADANYGGLICKNPLSDHWIVEWLHTEPYELGTLAEYLDLTKPKKRAKTRHSRGFSRHCDIFDDLREWAYQQISKYRKLGYDAWLRATQNIAGAFNHFSIPLLPSQVGSTVRSVANWVWRKCTPEWFSRKQRARIEARWGDNEEKRATARLMRAKGMTQQAIAEELGISQQTISRWCK